MGCGNCRYLMISPVRELLGFCVRRSLPVNWALEECGDVESLRLGEVEESLTRGNFAYCCNCRTTLALPGEVEDHALRGHSVLLGLVEEEVQEEVYAGD